MMSVPVAAALLLGGLASGCSADDGKEPSAGNDPTAAQGSTSCDTSVWFDGQRFTADAYLLEVEADRLPADPKRGRSIGSARSDCPGAEPEPDAFLIEGQPPDRAIWVEQLGPVAADDDPDASAPAG